MSEDSFIRRASEIRVPMSALFQTAMAVIIAYLLTMMLGMDARLARQEEQIKALGRESALHAEHAAESLKRAEEAHRSLWEAMRRKQERR